MNLLLLIAICCLAALELGQVPTALEPPTPREYIDFAMQHEGDANRGRFLFASEQRTVCSKCHSVDGKGDKAGPDLSAIGDKFPRRELIDAILEPSAAIAVGYGATIVETKDGDEFSGIIKQVTDDWLELMPAEGEPLRIATRDIQQQRGSNV